MGLKDFFTRNKNNKIDTQTVKNVKNGSMSFLNLSSLSPGGYSGSKVNFFNGFGLTADLRVVDLRTLQFRSLQMLRENSFASSIFRRLETKVINTGLRLRCTPPAEILSKFMTEEELQVWSTDTERKYEVWSKDTRLVGVTGKYTMGQMQRLAFNASLYSGDCLVIISINKLGLPQIELVDGINIASPPLNSSTNKIQHGVELDSKGREVAYHVYNDATLKYTRVPAYTTRGRKRAWLVRATESRIDDVRGLPLLSVVLQNINEIGKYMDSEQRAALINSYIAVVHEQSEKAAPTAQNPLKNMVKGSQTVENTDINNTNTYNEMQPGFLMTNLLPGETVKSFDTSRPNVNFGPFVEFCMKTMAHALEIPPEIMFLEFKSNFSASRQAKLDFNDYVQKAQSIFSDSFTQPIYNEWLTGMVLTNEIVAPGYVESLMNLKEWQVLGAWRFTKWRGLPNKSVDEVKQWKAIEIQIAKGALTMEAAADEFNGTDFYDNARRLKKEREALGIMTEKEEAALTTSQQIDNINDKVDDFMNSFEDSNNV